MLNSFNGASRVTERFFGNTKIRGFEANGIGPRDLAAPNRDPLGGNVFAVARFESEFPVGLPEEYKIRGGVFADFGSVWNLDNKSGGVAGGQLIDDKAHLRSSIGLSFFWTTALGPLRFNFAKALAKESYDRDAGLRSHDLHPVLMAGIRGAVALSLAVLGSGAARAQDPQAGVTGQGFELGPQATAPGPRADRPPIQSPVLTIKQQDLFERSAFGKASLARIADGMKALQAENRTIEARLEAEERDLTQRRATMAAPDFRVLGEAFDKKVEGIRTAQDAKSRAMSQERDDDQKQFFDLAFPILADLMRSMGAVALIDQSTVVLSLDRIDVTDLAIGPPRRRAEGRAARCRAAGRRSARADRKPRRRARCRGG